MSILLPPFVQERLTYTKQTSSKVRTTSKYVSKLQYYFTIPVFSIANTWKGASEIIKKYYYTLEKNFSILDYISLTSDGNYVVCVSWKPTINTIVRYKLWNHNEALLYIESYAGQAISKNFYIEIWSTNNALIAGGGKQLKISKFKIPGILCESGEIDLASAYSTCVDMTFNLTGFNPSIGEYYNVINPCLDTELINL